MIARIVKNTQRQTKKNAHIDMATDGCLSAKPIKNHAHSIKTTKNTHTHIATNGGLPIETIKKPCPEHHKHKRTKKPHTSQQMVACL